MAIWQQAQTFTIAAGQTATFTLRQNQPLERLTIWASSGGRVLADVTFQPRVNDVVYGAATHVVAASVGEVIYRSGGATTENDIIPYIPPHDTTTSRLTFDVLVTNAGGAAVTVSLIAAAIAHQG